MALVLSACGGGSTLSLEIRPDDSIEQLDDVSRLDYRVYTVSEVDEIIAEATNPDGNPVTGVSCELIATAAPDAVDCVESMRTVLRDGDLVADGEVPPSGRVEVERSDDVRVYVELPGDQVFVGNAGLPCRWNAVQVVPADTEDAVVAVLPSC